MAIRGSDRRSQAATTREAVTFFRVIAQSDRYSLLRVEPETGRTHQIRVHLAWLKHPVVGDPVYGKGKNELGVTRQFLHAWSITFRHPSTNTEMTKTAPLPADLIQALEKIGIDAAEVLVK